MPVKEKIICIGKGVVFLMLVGYLFYGKILYGAVFLPYLYFHYRAGLHQYHRKRQNEKMRQFKDGMMALGSALSAGYSVENAFRQALGELRVLYGERAEIVTGFEQIVHRLGMNGNAEEAVQAFAQRSGIEDALYFAEVFRYVRRSGGDMTAIIKKTTENINGRLEVLREIEVMVTGRCMEQKVMNAVPFGIILYIRMTAREFIEPLYGNIAGVLVMSGCLAVYLLSVRWAEKIIEIEV